MLVVDGSVTSRRVLSNILDSWGITNLAVESAEAALMHMTDAAKKGAPYRLIIVDAHLPDTTCLCLCRRIKADDKLKTAGLIAMVRLAELNYSEHYLEAGFDFCLPKPVGRSALYDCVVSVLSPGRAPGERANTRQRSSALRHKTENQRFNILLAEDNPTNQMVAEAIIQSLGYRLHIVENGAEAIEALSVKNYDLVLMDCQMPVMDGYTATERIRSGESRVLNPRVPIAAMTANAMDSDKRECLEAGMDDYLPKPVTSEAVAAMLGKWLVVDKAVEDAAADVPKPEPVLESDEPDCPVFDEGSLLSRLGGNEELVRKILLKFVDDMPRRVELLKDAIAGGNLEEARLQAHTIKGSSRNVGAEMLGQAAEKLEKACRAEEVGSLTELTQHVEARCEEIKDRLAA